MAQQRTIPVPRQTNGQPRRTKKQEEALASARRALRNRNGQAAFDLLKPLVQKLNKDPDVLRVMAAACEMTRKHKLAYEYAEKSLKYAEDVPEALLLMARVDRLEGKTDRAVGYCDRVLRILPNHVDAQVVKGGALEEAGRFDDALEVMEPLVNDPRTASDFGVRFEWAKLLVQFKRYDEAIELIDELVDKHKSRQEHCRMLYHLKAKACDRSKEFASAYHAAYEANQIGMLEFDPDLYFEQVSTLIEIWNEEDLKKFPRSDCDSEIPIFVAGMPRSGTSLIDQVIDAHPEAAGVGELADIQLFARQLDAVYDSDLEPPECFGKFGANKAFTRVADRYLRHIRKLSPPRTQRIVNKALGNNKLVGLLALLFPKTRIIHAVRDPRDVAISCYMGGFNNWLNPWTVRMDWAARAWEQSWRMMDYWKDVLDVPILDVHYEAMVADPENQFRRMIEFLGLEWNESCLEFYKTKRTVRTLSYDQVNRPIYTSSSGRHLNYADFIRDIDWPEYRIAS